MGLTDWPTDHYDCECHRYQIPNEGVWKIPAVLFVTIGLAVGFLWPFCALSGLC